MNDRLIDPADIAFQLDEVLDIDSLMLFPRFAGQDRADYDAILGTARTIATEKFLNHYAKSDREEPQLRDGSVVLPPEIAEGVKAFHDAGFAGAHHDEELGGLQLPWTVVQAAFAYFQAANIATAAYPFLTIAAANLIEAHGSKAQKERYLGRMISGDFFGTMALSEPHAGSSLSDIRTTARPREDGTYAIKGGKMWTSGGEHEMGRNIVHMLLARIEGAPAGIKGLSLFIVPRYRLDADGNPGEPNDVALAGLNHKMGYRGTVNTVMNFGDNDGCIGELVGEPNKGLSYMFHMMNEARIGVGMGAGMLAYAGYRESLAYARERQQGRPPGEKDPAAPQIPLIGHADVRRMLAIQKAVAEGTLALGLLCARWVDERQWAPEKSARNEAHLKLEIVTPVLKSWFSDAALRANEAAIQILGGYGYTRDFAVEQIYRDNRLNPIHEGANAIQALDLLGRKVALQDGAALKAFGWEISKTLSESRKDFPDEYHALGQAWTRLSAVTETLLQRQADHGAAASLAPAQSYIDAFGNIVMAWIWLKQAVAASKAGRAYIGETFRKGKIETCRFVFRWELPKAVLACAQLETLGDGEAYPAEDAF
ncbi:acyl-CoA dehydrogenase [Hwanghaeella grinnelliae]|uniref:Acyl-CoA dehydrogenase n=1 Tax=Hwanghaeella grinnelliae TaxID=2500179 RepID=A0A437QGZ4_9PROT|nr:acyl-CoA dehydrogenase [Hwanghaeella grinnelliae]RVU33843.1 acyl-CoA dehydrogenase [Hwanghaeella grinnelliae]